MSPGDTGVPRFILIFANQRVASSRPGYGKTKVKILKAYSTRYSQAVTHPSTDRARRCFTSVFGREPVFSTWYGRKHFDKER